MSGEDLLAPVRALYEAYIEKAKQLERDKKLGDGWMGLKPGPKDDPCHGQFAKDLERLLAELAARHPTSAQARAALEYMFRAAGENRSPQTVYWMFQAVEGMSVELAGFLDPADARNLRDLYAKQHKRWERLPAQQKALAALEKAARG